MTPEPRSLYSARPLTFYAKMLCLPNGLGWYVPEPGRPMDGWDICPGDMEGRSLILSDLTDHEIDLLCNSRYIDATIEEIKAARCLQEAAKAAADKAKRALEGRSTLYLTPREPAVRLSNGNLWILYPSGSEMSPPRSPPSDWIEIAQDLTSAEVASLVDPDKRLLAIFKILSARKPAPEGCDEAEVERWRKVAERAEIDRGEWQALCMNHEGAIERLTRDLDEARGVASERASTIDRLTRERDCARRSLKSAYTEADEAHRRADAAEPEVERLRQIVIALAARLSGIE